MSAVIAPRVGRPALLPAYRSGQRCPDCDGDNWLLGRAAAECGRCGLPLPLAPVALKETPR